MSWSVDNGFSPRTFEDVLQEFTDSINKNFNQNYTVSSIVGTNFYKTFYQAIQQVLNLDNSITDLSNKLVDYLRVSDEEISIPKSSPDGIIGLFESELGLKSSYKPIRRVEDIGLVNIAVDIDPEKEGESWEAKKADILKLIGKYGDGSSIYQGEHTGEYVAINGQNFPVAFSTPNVIPLYIDIQVTKSANSNADTKDPKEIERIFKENFEKDYRFGYNFEPERYLTIDDLPYAEKILLRHSIDDLDYSADVKIANFNDKFIIKKVKVSESV